MSKQTGAIRCLVVAVVAMAMTGCGVIRDVTGLGEPTLVFAVSCGAEEAYKDADGKQWLADKEMVEGADWGAADGMTVVRDPVAIPGTQAPNVYLTERYSLTAYEFKLKDGKYTVRLHFAETYDGITDAGERLFSVSINDKVVLKDLDVFKEAGGLNKPLIKEFEGVAVSGGKLTIGFTTNVQNPEINGIEILAE